MNIHTWQTRKINTKKRSFEGEKEYPSINSRNNCGKAIETPVRTIRINRESSSEV
jgi:hypothetical protein